MNSIRIFLSSPGDVAQERRIAGRVLERLDAEFPGVKLEPYFWEYEPMLITKDYQEQIPPPSSFDIVICILWSRMGSRMHTKYQREDGSTFRSGTEYEFVDAVEGQRRNDGTPDVLVWINKTQPLIPLEPEEVHMERLRQWRELKAFLEEWTRDEEEQTFKGAVNRYARLDEFEEKLEVKLRKLITARLEGEPNEAAPRDAEITWKRGSPFRGLQAYDFEHAPVFFGRTAAVAEAIEALRRQGHERGSSFLMVAGASGSGKSSLVRAGVLPMLVEPGVIEGIGLWRRAVMRPGDAADPFAAVAAALLEPEALPEIGTDGTSVEELAAMLRERPEQALGLGQGALGQAAALVHAEDRRQLSAKIDALRKEGRSEDADSASKRLEKLAPPTARLALLIDQFEEIFSDAIDAGAKDRFVKLVAALAGSGRIFVIATIRSDFFPHCADFPELLELTRGDGILQLGPPTPAELGQMIRQPAQAAGLRFEADAASGEALDEILRDAAVDQPTVLPLLGFCLQQLYERRVDGRLLSLEAYRELGGVEGAVAQRAEDVFAGLPPEAQSEFPRLMRAAVTIGGSEEDTATRRRADYVGLAGSPAMKRLVDALVEARLFVADADEGGSPQVAVAHEALLRCWPRMAEAIDEDREFLRGRARIARAAKRWTEEDGDPGLLLPAGKQLEEGREMLEQRAGELGEDALRFIEQSSSAERRARKRRIRRLQIIAASFGVLAVAAVCAGLYAMKQRSVAERNEHEAVRLRGKAEEIRGGADQLIESTLYNLRGKLIELGKPEYLEEVSAAAELYFKGIPREFWGPWTERQLGTALNMRGDALLAAGDAAGARAKYEASLEIARRRYEEDRDGDQRARDLVITLVKLADLAKEEGDLDAAEALRAEAAALPIEDDHEESQADEIRALLDEGDALTARGDKPGATRAFEKAVDLAREMVFDPENPLAARTVSSAFSRLAVAKKNAGRIDEAKELAEISVGVAEELVEFEPESLLYQTDLVIGLNHYAGILRLAGDVAGAREVYDRVLEITRKIHAQKPSEVDATQQLLYAFNGAGLIRMADEDPQEFIDLYAEGVQIARDLVKRVPGLAEPRQLLATLLNGLSFGQFRQGDHAGVVRSSEEAITALDGVKTMDYFVATTYRGAFERLFTSLRAQGMTEDRLHPYFRRSLNVGLRIREAGLADDKLEHGIEYVQQQLGMDWDPGKVTEELTGRFDEFDAGANFTAYADLFNRLVHAMQSAGASEEKLVDLHRKALATTLELREAGSTDPGVEPTIAYLRGLLGESPSPETPPEE